MNINEALRYIGVPEGKAEEELKEKVRQGFKQLERIGQPKVIYQKLPIKKKENLVIIGSPICQTKSKDINKLLEHCQECIVMAATLGFGVDKEISKLQKVDMVEAMVLDACASVLIDEVCDDTEQEIINNLSKNQFLTMRFSPGYGDTPLELNEAILKLLMAQKRIGLNLTKSHMLIPSKSVTAFIGISNQKEKREKSCNQCHLRNTCSYRKRGERCGI